MTAAQTFDRDGFHAALDATRIARGLSWRQVSAETGVSPSTFTRMIQGKRCDLDSFGALADWAGLDVSLFFHRSGQRHPPAPLAALTVALNDDPSLSMRAREALTRVIPTVYEAMRGLP